LLNRKHSGFLPRDTAAAAGVGSAREAVSLCLTQAPVPLAMPLNMIGRFLDDGDLRKLHGMLLKKKLPAPSIGRRTGTKRKVPASVRRSRSSQATCQWRRLL
jgi:hypothetical protein